MKTSTNTKIDDQEYHIYYDQKALDTIEQSKWNGRSKRNVRTRLFHKKKTEQRSFVR